MHINTQRSWTFDCKIVNDCDMQLICNCEFSYYDTHTHNQEKKKTYVKELVLKCHLIMYYMDVVANSAIEIKFEFLSAILWLCSLALNVHCFKNSWNKTLNTGFISIFSLNSVIIIFSLTPATSITTSEKLFHYQQSLLLLPFLHKHTHVVLHGLCEWRRRSLLVSLFQHLR